jgi:hypothetical protein
MVIMLYAAWRASGMMSGCALSLGVITNLNFLTGIVKSYSVAIMTSRIRYLLYTWVRSGSMIDFGFCHVAVEKLGRGLW